ncbi:hypothetical protein GCM10010330_37090 [Streptomyces tendae]|uniref:hypothetical protein n=1 Tax=Streptomyces tendae TaxID=1932 RepID=UPI0016727DB7|nr:hypothetical protein [Streptomyces tendae]GHA79783.1 hypothetical protein GCM10010330_37090 [Streptomyces tendae]
MRRTARALSVAVLASAALGISAGAGAADPGVPPPPADVGEPVAPPSADDPAAVPPPTAEEAVPPSAGQAAAHVSPVRAAPGDTVTVSVSCGPTGGAAAPASLDATSAAFEKGTVELRKVADDGGTGSGPAYRGTARIAAAGDFAAEPGAQSTKNSTDTQGAAGTEGTEGSAETEDWAGTEGAGTEGAGTEGAAGVAEDWTVDGACPDASGGEDGDPWSATMSVPEESGAGAGTGAAQPACRETAAPRAGTSTHGTPCAPTKPACPETPAPRGEPAARGTSCTGGTAEHGVQAGTGGTFGDSVPALVAGGLLIAGACGAAAHRLRLRLRGENGER